MSKTCYPLAKQMFAACVNTIVVTDVEIHHPRK